MTKAANDPRTVDPDSIQETLCLGKFNVTVNGPLATITFTHGRPKVSLLVDSGIIDVESVVRARIVTSVENLAALRDLLNKIIQDPSTPAASAGGTSRLN